MFTVVITAIFVLLAPHVAWYVNIPLVLLMGLCLLGDAASKKRHVQYLTFGYILLVDFAAPHETSLKDGWNWVAWVDLVWLLLVTLGAAVLVFMPDRTSGDSARPAPLLVAPRRPVPASRRRPARVEALRRQAERARSRRR
ncbi:hypothetical protein ACN2WE_23235 [Streptomyces sp. cg28]|uniref:hypothetical protein n=1 Tax=Streptomyces sp. cg28 TaxID=3403457 RepID=UPI003B22791E